MPDGRSGSPACRFCHQASSTTAALRIPIWRGVPARRSVTRWNWYRLISLLKRCTDVDCRSSHGREGRLEGRCVFRVPAGCDLSVHIAVSGWARFYSLAAAAYACTIACLLRTPSSPRWRWRRAGVGLTLLTHELCLTLLPLPMFLWPADGGAGKRSSWWRGVVVVLCGFAAAEALLIALHFLAPNQALNPWVYQSAVAGADHARAAAPLAPVALARPPVLVACGLIAAVLSVGVGRRAPLVAALCAVSAVFFQLGVMTLVVAVAILLRPQRARVYLPCALVFAGMAVLFWSVHTWSVSSARFSVELVTSLTKDSLAYPLDAVTFFAGSLPVTTCVLAVAAGASLNATGDDRCSRVRAPSASSSSVLSASPCSGSLRTRDIS